MVRDLWSDVLRSNDEGIGMTVGLELSHPARQCDDKPTESVGSKLARLWGLNLWGETSDDLGTLTLEKKNNEMYQSRKEYERLENYKNKRKKSVTMISFTKPTWSIRENDMLVIYQLY